ncbi:uncharacterized protein LOC144711916 [Wolffia australiana]
MAEDDDEEDCFFHSFGRVPSVSFHLPALASSSSDTDADDPRASFASAIAAPSDLPSRCSSPTDPPPGDDYGVWIGEPSSIQDRRRRLLQGLGLAQEPTPIVPSPPPPPPSIVRSKSDLGGDSRNARNLRLERLLGSPLRSSSLLRCLSARNECGFDGKVLSLWAEPEKNSSKVCTIKNLDTGKEFVIDGVVEEGPWNRLCDPQTGNRLTLEEFERSIGYSPIVRELMRREIVEPLGPAQARIKERPSGKKKRTGWLKNIREVASSVTALMLEKDRELGSSSGLDSSSSSSSSSSEWMKVRQSRKPFKELTGLYLCQEIRAHQGSIWTIKFSLDAQMLASAGEDKVIHVWQVSEGDDLSVSPSRSDMGGNSPDKKIYISSPDQLDGQDSHRLSTKILSQQKRKSVPGHVFPGTVFSLTQQPICSFRGHLDDVLDLSWSKSQHLLSSSMDKTVRLWDVGSKTCLKMFAHNDYVTCIQFNPVDERYFISGSLDAKVRIWSVPDRQVVDWTDLPDMITAACYTPDGHGALVGSHKGTCRFYSTSDGKLDQKAQFEIQNKKKRSHAKKITGFQFVPGNPSEVLITSADSQIRIFDGIQITHKFRGFRNTSSQMSASCTADGNYVICASEDSNVYVWKKDEMPKAGGGSTGKGKTWVTTRSHEHFHCKDVSVAIPWPPSRSVRIEPHLVFSCLRQQGHQSPSRSPNKDIIPSGKMKRCSPSERAAGSCLEEEVSRSSQSEPLSSSSSFSSSGWLMSGTLSSASPPTGGSQMGNQMLQSSTAWGLVVVTAGLGGEIKIFQNFGLPRLLNRQSNIL